MLSHKNANFSLLLKNEENIVILAFDGMIALINLENQTFLKINYCYYEILFKKFLEILDFFMDIKPYDDESINVISKIKENTLKWIPKCNNNVKKVTMLLQNNHNIAVFSIRFNFEHFSYFIKSFVNCILSTLLLDSKQKAIFQTLFDQEFDWAQFELPQFNEIYLKKYFKSKIDNFLFESVDISNLILIFKYYFPLFQIIKNGNNLILLTLEVEEEEQSSNS